MLHLKCLFHSGRQKRDNTSDKCNKDVASDVCWVVVVALRLVLNLSGTKLQERIR